MENLRIVADNAADRAALSASSTAGALGVGNLKVDDKATTWRSVGTTARLSGLLTEPEIASCAVLASCNLSPTAEIRVRLTNEAAATNLLLYSEALFNEVYIKSNVEIPQAGIAPDGTETAILMRENLANSAHYVEQLCETLADTEYTYSMFLRANSDGRTRGRINVGTLGAFADFDIAGFGAIVASGGEGYVRASVSVVGVLGIYRVELTFQTSVAAMHNMVLFLANAAGALSYTGNGSTGFYYWGGQLEIGGAATSYYPTTNAPATRPVGFIDSWQSYSLDTGPALACPAPAGRPRGFTAAQAASAYFNGGGAYAHVWFEPTEFIGFAVDIADAANLQGYIEAARLIIGAHWAPEYNAAAAPWKHIDSTALFVNAAGGTMARAGHLRRQVDIDLQYMNAADRATFCRILMNSRAYPILLSVFPGHVDSSLERDYMVYGYRPEDSDVSIQYAAHYASKLGVVEL